MQKVGTTGQPVRTRKPWVAVVQEAPIPIVSKGEQHPAQSGYNGHDNVATIRGR